MNLLTLSSLSITVYYYTIITIFGQHIPLNSIFLFLWSLTLLHCFFFFNDPAPTEISPLPLPDALPISSSSRPARSRCARMIRSGGSFVPACFTRSAAVRLRAPTASLASRIARTSNCSESSSAAGGDRKSTRLNSTHGHISYAVLCLHKK